MRCCKQRRSCQKRGYLVGDCQKIVCKLLKEGGQWVRTKQKGGQLVRTSWKTGSMWSRIPVTLFRECPRGSYHFMILHLAIYTFEFLISLPFGIKHFDSEGKPSLTCNVLSLLYLLPWTYYFKRALDKYNIIPKAFPKKARIFIPIEVLAWVMTTCWVLRSWLTYFWRNKIISSIFYFSKSTSINRSWYTIPWPMGHYEDEVVHKIPFEIKMQWQNQLKISLLI